MAVYSWKTHRFHWSILHPCLMTKLTHCPKHDLSSAPYNLCHSIEILLGEEWDSQFIEDVP